MLTLNHILGFFSFWMGACIASFLNVVIWRVPRGESIVSPPSHCPKCNAPIRWYQNVPILAWLALRGKCANCNAPISPRYILVETLGGCLFLATFLVWLAPVVSAFVRDPQHVPLLFPALQLLVVWIWISLMIVGSFIDYDLQLLPDFVTVGGMVLGVGWNLLKTLVFELQDLSGLLGDPAHSIVRLFDCSVIRSLLGLALGFGLLWLIRFLGSKAFRREAMGLGDVFLMGAIGALCGPVAVLVTLILSSLIGSVVGVGMILLQKAKLGGFTPIPFGPYLCLGCVAWMFWGPQLVRWYLRLLSFQ